MKKTAAKKAIKKSTKKTKKSTGRTRKKTAEQWCEPTNLALIQGWTRDGATMSELAEKMHITRKTLYSWRTDYPPIDKAVKQGKEAIDYAVEGSLLKKALSGDTKAMIFWLQNRKPEEWRRRNKEDQELNRAKRDQAKAQAEIAKKQVEQISTAGDQMIKQMKGLTTDDLKELAHMVLPEKQGLEDNNAN